MTSPPSANARDLAPTSAEALAPTTDEELSLSIPPGRPFTRLCAFLSKACLVLAIIGLLCIVVSVQTQVIGRYVFNDTPTWTEALALQLVLYVTAFGVAVGVRDAGHIGLDSLVAMRRLTSDSRAVYALGQLALWMPEGEASVPHPAWAWNHEKAKESVRRLAALEPKVVCAGHERPLRGENLRETLERAAEKL